MARVMSKAYSSSSSGDVLSSIRKLVANEAQQGLKPAKAPEFRSSKRAPATVPFRHANGARDWLVGAIDEEKRSAAVGGHDGVPKPLNLNKPVGQNSKAQAADGRDWKPRISLALV